MTILEIKQGHAGNLTDQLLEHAVAALEANDEVFQRRYPGCTPYRAWSVREEPEGRTAVWGCVWYQVGEDQRLKIHSVQYDSSG